MSQSAFPPSKMRLWYVISDIHGNYKAFRNLLLHAKLIDEENQWRGGDAHLFLLGDYVAGSNDCKPVVDLIRSLERQAPGQVVSLLGNHELLLLRAIYDDHHRHEWLLDLKNWQTIASWAVKNEELVALLAVLQVPSISTQEMTQIYQEIAKMGQIPTRIKPTLHQWSMNQPAPSSTHCRRAWAVFLQTLIEDGTLEWMRRLPVAYRQDEWGFFHAGPPSEFDGDIDDLNVRFHRRLQTRQFDHPLLEPHNSPTSPVSTRLWWSEAAQVDRLFNQFGVKQCAFGHHPEAIKPRGILGQVWNKVVSTDAYMRSGIEAVIRIRGSCVDVIYTDSSISILQQLYPQQVFRNEQRLIG